MALLENVVTEKRMDRRSVLRAAIAGLSSFMGFALGGPITTYLFAKNRGTEPNGWADAGDLAELSRTAPQEISFEGRQTDSWNTEYAKASAWIVCKRDGSITAFSPWCTHLGCAYHWEPKRSAAAGGCFVCPCHGSTFDVTGKVIEGPAPRPLDQYKTRTIGGRLWLLPSTEDSQT